MNKVEIKNEKYFTTPQWLYDELDKEFDFNLDPCCTTENMKCAIGYPVDNGYDGLKESWTGHRVFMNPPYDSNIGSWVEKALLESKRGSLVVGLLPAMTGSEWFHAFVYKKSEVRFLKGRLKIENENNNFPHPLMLVIWRD